MVSGQCARDGNPGTSQWRRTHRLSTRSIERGRCGQTVQNKRCASQRCAVVRKRDSLDNFDTTTDQFAGAISGFANVGECRTVLPDSSQVWENGADACDSPQYDHIGCPFVPGGLLNIVSTSTNKVHAVGVRGARLLCATFSPDGEFAALGTTDHLMLVRTSDLALIGSLPIGSTGQIAFSDDGLKAYVPVNAKSQIAVIQTGVQVRSLRLSRRETGDRTVQVAIQSDADFDAKSIDPSSLWLAGVAAERRKDGVLDASVERVTGTEGHSLIVKFNLAWERHTRGCRFAAQLVHSEDELLTLQTPVALKVCHFPRA